MRPLVEQGSRANCLLVSKTTSVVGRGRPGSSWFTALERHKAAVKTERARKAEERKVAAERKQALRNRKDQHRRIEKQRREEKTSHPANVPSSMVSLLNNRLITHL